MIIMIIIMIITIIMIIIMIIIRHHPGDYDDDCIDCDDASKDSNQRSP